MDFKPFDKRHYPTLDVQAGYRAWAPSYEATVQDQMDLRLLRQVTSIHWPSVRCAVDLACGTGRIGAWLTGQGVTAIDGIDFTPAMLERARARGIYRNLVEADVRDTRLPANSYDLAVEVLADEHLPDLRPLYAEAARLTKNDGSVVVVGYHPHFLMSGIPTHFDDAATGEPLAIESYIHLFSDHVAAAQAAGWRLSELHEGVVDGAWIEKKPQWARLLNHPVSFAFAWHKHRPVLNRADSVYSSIWVPIQIGAWPRAGARRGRSSTRSAASSKPCASHRAPPKIGRTDCGAAVCPAAARRRA